MSDDIHLPPSRKSVYENTIPHHQYDNPRKANEVQRVDVTLAQEGPVTNGTISLSFKELLLIDVTGSDPVNLYRERCKTDLRKDIDNDNCSRQR